jgi:sugar phosphate isomerase/epimerase
MSLIYISSSCSPSDRIGDAVRNVLAQGYTHVELSGGSEWYPELEQDLMALRAKGLVQLLCHNYFPPPREHFIINLASLDPVIRSRSLELLGEAIRLSARLGATAFGLHAGFLVDLRTEEAGRTVGRRRLFDRDSAEAAFWDGYDRLHQLALGCGVTLYLENNVYSSSNYLVYGEERPFLLTCHAEYVDLMRQRGFNLLLDLAHLKVSCRTLGLDFEKEYVSLAASSDYWHISENDGLEDTNDVLTPDSSILATIARHHFRPKLMTIEVRGTDAALASVDQVRRLCGDRRPKPRNTL